MRPIVLTLLMLSAFVLVGCSGNSTGEGLIQDEITKRDAQISELKGALEDKSEVAERTTNELESTRARAEDAERQVARLSSQTQTTVASGEGSLLPPSAKPGECYARVVIDPVYENRSERVMVKEASDHIEIVPAKYEWTEERVLVKEASTRIETIPATYAWVEETMLVKPASSVIKDVPAVYTSVDERILVTPARTYWKKGSGLIEKVDGNTGELMCLVEEPAVYRTVSKRVLKTSATTTETALDAEYETVRKQVVKTPATTKTVEIPAEYGTVKVRKLVSPASENHIPVPAEYADISQRVMVEASHMEWRRVLCETNITNAVVADVQQALQAKGHNPGAIDGIYGSQTQTAVRAFQTAQDMPVGGLTYETLSALGINARK